MDFELTEEQGTLRDVSRSLLNAACTPELVRSVMDNGRDLDDKLWDRGAELGWTLLAVPEDQDGAGAGLLELSLVAEELGRAVAPGPWTDTALAAHAVARAGVLPDVLAGLLDGTRKAAVIDAGSPGLVQAAAAVDHLLVLDSDVARLVDTAAVTVRRRATLDQSRAWYAVDLAGAEGTVVATGADAAWLRDAATVLTAADALGVGERLLEMTVAYAGVREQFGRPIGSFQVVKHGAADMLAALKGVRAATYYAAMALEARTTDATRAAHVAKAFASEQIPLLAGRALQTHGGIGFTWEHDLHLYLRRAKVDEALFGDAGVHHDHLSSLLF